ncbi:DNA primase [Bradyrhizobium elkanii]
MTDTSHRISDADIDRAKAVRVADNAVERGLVLKRAGRELSGPCPLCGGDDRFSIHIDKDLFHCRGCSGSGAGAITFTMWLDGVGFRQAVETLAGGVKISSAPVNLGPALPVPSTPATDHDRRQHEKAAWLWSQRLPIIGSIAETYLRARGITCPSPASLAFLPPTKLEHHPAMIAAFGLFATRSNPASSLRRVTSSPFI